MCGNACVVLNIDVPAMGIPSTPQWEDPDHAIDNRTINTGGRRKKKKSGFQQTLMTFLETRRRGEGIALV